MGAKEKHEPKNSVINKTALRADNDRTRFDKLFGHSYGGVLIFDGELRLIYQNPSAKDITGWNSQDVEGREFASLIFQDDRVPQELLMQLTTGEPGSVNSGQFRIQHISGNFINAELSITNLLQEPGIKAVLVDLIEVPKQEIVSIRHKEDFFGYRSGHSIAAIMDNLPAMIAYFSADLKCLFANKPYQEHFGRGDEVVGRRKYELMGAAEYRDHEGHLKAVLKGKNQSFERSLPGKDGTTVHTHTQYLPDGKSGPVKGFYSIIYDISEIRSAEKQASDQAAQMQKLLDRLTDGFIAIDEEERYTYVNKKLADMVGLDREAMLGRKVWDLFPDAVGSSTYKSIKHALSEKEFVCNEDYYKPLGLWQENRIHPTEHGLLIFIQDISARKKTEEDLRQSNERFKLIARATQDALFEWNLVTGEIWWSESHYTLFGFDATCPMPGQEEWLARLSADARELFNDIAIEVANGSISHWEHEVAYIRPDGYWGTLLARGFVVCDIASKATRILGSFIDISERYRMEQQHALLADISHHFRQGGSLSDIMLSVVSGLKNFAGGEEICIWLKTPGGQELMSVSGNGKKSLGKAETIAYQIWEQPKGVIDNDGITGIPLFNDQDLIGVLTVALGDQLQPLLNQKSFQEALGHHLGLEIWQKQLTEQSQLLFDRAPDMIGIMGIDRYFKKVNPAMCIQLEYSEEELLLLPLDLLIHPDDLETSRSRTKAFMEGGDQTMYFENRFVSKGGKTVWLYWTVTRSANDGFMFCVGKNISDKKEMEVLLTKAYEIARIGGWEVDRVTGTAYWSPITREIYEVPESFTPSIANWLSFYEEGPDRDYVAGKMAEVIAKGKSCDIEVEIVTANGKKCWVRAIAEAEFSAGQCVRVYGSFQDIDNRKKAELAALAALKDRDSILESIDDGFFAVDRHWTTTYWNNAAERMMGKKREELIGEYFWNKYPEVTELDSYRHFKKAMQTGKTVRFEDFYPPMKTWFSVNAYPSENGLSVFFRDITENKRAIQALADSEKRYSDLFQLSPLPMFVYEMSTLRYVDVNIAALTHYGYSREEFLAMTVFDIRPAEDMPLIKKAIIEHKNDPKVRMEGIFRHCKKNGDIIRVDIQSNIITFNDVKCKVVLANDVTERTRYIQAIESQNEKLKEVSWMQSHVIRAPLSRIMGLLPMLELPRDNPEQQQIIDYLTASANELDGVIRSITQITSVVQIEKSK